MKQQINGLFSPHKEVFYDYVKNFKSCYLRFDNCRTIIRTIISDFVIFSPWLSTFINNNLIENKATKLDSFLEFIISNKWEALVLALILPYLQIAFQINKKYQVLLSEKKSDSAYRDSQQGKINALQEKHDSIQNLRNQLHEPRIRNNIDSLWTEALILLTAQEQSFVKSTLHRINENTIEKHHSRQNDFNYMEKRRISVNILINKLSEELL